jgi:hypothetical protein
MPFDQLPKSAALRFTELREAVDEAQTRVLATQRRIKSAEDNRKNVTDKKAIAEITEEIDRLSCIRDDQQWQFQQKSRLVTAINTFVVGLPRSIQLEPHQRLVIMDEFANSESVDNAVIDLRERIEKLKNELRRAQRSIPPIEDAYRDADARVAALIEEGRPRLRVDGKNLEVKFATDSLHGPGTAKDAVATLAWMHPEQMRKRLREEVQALYGNYAKTNTPIMSKEERDKTIEALRLDLLQCERNEEFAIATGEHMNLFVPRREDADPLAVLSLEIVKRQRAVA